MEVDHTWVKLLFGKTKGFYWSFNGGARWIRRPKMEGEGLSHHSAQNKLHLLLLLLLHGKQFHLEPLKRPPLHSSPRDLDLNALWKTKTDLASVCLCLWGNLFLFILSELFLPSRPPPLAPMLLSLIDVISVFGDVIGVCRGFLMPSFHQTPNPASPSVIVSLFVFVLVRG